ncbi:MAG: hypothetical protein KGI89_15735, partial [Euryarchaeota archaeon]|nr:hypothetical protein [Euryarchaeota archaeon]
MPFPPAGGITQLTGDVTAGPGSGSQAAALKAVGTAGTVGDSSHYPIITTDAEGRVTSATAQASGGSLTNSESYIAANVSIPSVTPTSITSLSLAAGTWLIIGRVEVVSTTSGAFDVYLGPNNNSAAGAYAGATDYNVATEFTTLEIAKIVTLGATTTVYLGATAAVASTALYQSDESSANNATGLL